MLMVIQFVSKERKCFLLLLKSFENGLIDFLRQCDDLTTVYESNRALVKNSLDRYAPDFRKRLD